MLGILDDFKVLAEVNQPFGEDDTSYDDVGSFGTDEPYWQETEYDETVLFEHDQPEYPEWDEAEFDEDAAYYNEDEPSSDPAAEAESLR